MTTTMSSSNYPD